MREDFGRMVEIVRLKTEGIYKDEEKFCAVIKDYYPNRSIGKLLRNLVKLGVAKDVCELKRVGEKDLQLEYKKMMMKVSEDTSISVEKLAPAIEILCAGLGLEIIPPKTPTPVPPFTTVTPTPTPIPTATAIPTANPNVKPTYTHPDIALPASPINDFVIDNGTLIKYVGKDATVVIPNIVTVIGNGAFKEYHHLKKIVIPTSVTMIGEEVFYNAIHLTDVHVPPSVTYIGKQTFFNCELLKEIFLPDSIKIIEEFLFNSSENLQRVGIPRYTQSIGDCAFNGCESLREIILPDTLKSIGDFAFTNCKSLRSIYIPTSVTQIGDLPFNCCENLATISLPRHIPTSNLGLRSTCRITLL